MPAVPGPLPVPPHPRSGRVPPLRGLPSASSPWAVFPDPSPWSAKGESGRSAPCAGPLTVRPGCSPHYPPTPSCRCPSLRPHPDWVPRLRSPQTARAGGPTGRAVVGGRPLSAHREGQRRQQGELPKPPEEPRSPYLKEEAQHEGQRPEAEAGAYLLGVDTLVGVQTLLLLHLLQLRGERPGRGHTAGRLFMAGWRAGPRNPRVSWLPSGRRMGLREVPCMPGPAAAGSKGAPSWMAWLGTPGPVCPVRTAPIPACLFGLTR